MKLQQLMKSEQDKQSSLTSELAKKDMVVLDSVVLVRLILKLKVLLVQQF